MRIALDSCRRIEIFSIIGSAPAMNHRYLALPILFFAIAIIPISQSDANELLAAWEFNGDDRDGDQIKATGGSVANTAGALQGAASIARELLF